MIDITAFLPPYQRIELPSKGQLYTVKSPLGDGWIEIREYCAHEETLISNMNAANAQPMLNSILESCVKPGGIPIDDLTAEDAYFLFVWLRINSYSAMMDLEVTCPHVDCRYGPKTYTIDLSELPIIALEDHIHEPVAVFLPRTKLTAYTKALRRGKEVQAFKRAAILTQERGHKGDPTSALKRAYCIEKFTMESGEEITSPMDIERLCLDILPSGDTLVLDRKLEVFNHGVDSRVMVECYQCSRPIYTQVPPGPEFFRPTRLPDDDPGESVVRNSYTDEIWQP